ncbi:MAG: alpha/beta fold hydrolase [Myxococcales bacterium]|nr:alpha/beta fold hydrolase [Myxococcales bacterium]
MNLSWRMASLFVALASTSTAGCVRSSCVQAPPSVLAAAQADRGAQGASVADAGAARATSAADPQFLADYTATLRFSLGAPTRVTLSPDGSRAYFLRSGPRSFVRDLYVLEASGAPARVLVTAESILRGGEEQLSAEERARRERQRQTGRGITAYEPSPDGTKLLVPLSGKLYIVDAQTGAARELSTQQRGAPVDARWSPDGRMISLVRGGEVYVVDVATGRERALTTSAGAGISHGTAEFVAQEEMDRMEGYWWSGDGRSIAFQETDERGVEELRVSNPTRPDEAPEVNRYPRAGRPNAVVRLGVVPVAGGRPTWIEWDRARYPYLARVTWPARGPLTIVVQNRAQSEVVVLTADASTGVTRAILTERDEAWVNLEPGLPRWLGDGSGFLWASEASGESALELRSPTGALVRRLGESAKFRALISVDEAARAAYVTGGEEPSETHVFKVSLEDGAATSLTRGRAEHEMVFARAGGARVHTTLAIDGPRAWVFERADGTSIAALPSVAEEPRAVPNVEIVTVGAERFRAAIVRPRNFRRGTRYPVIDAVYGGPGARQVTSARHRYAMSQWLADHGFIVVSIDGRGTPYRGRQWERALRLRLDDTPLDDQVSGLRALGQRYNELDLGRVGVYGWSFGGYLSALAALRAPSVFHAAVAGAPVTDWREYDTHYTERYMGMPEGTPQERAAYERSSLVAHASELSRPLLLVHGTADDNVYFSHSALFSSALFRAGKSHEFLPLVGFTHIVPDPVVNERLYRRIAEFFVQHLAP